jgi:hypothetical protein
MIFVGNAQKTSNALCKLLLNTSQYCEYMLHILETMCGGRSGENRVVINRTLFPF